MWTRAKNLLALIVRPEPTYRVAHLPHPRPGDTIEQTAVTCRSHRLLQRRDHPLVPRRLQADLGQVKRAVAQDKRSSASVHTHTSDR